MSGNNGPERSGIDDALRAEVHEANSSGKEAMAKRLARERLDALAQSGEKTWKEKRAERKAERRRADRENLSTDEKAALEMSGISTKGEGKQTKFQEWQERQAEKRAKRREERVARRTGTERVRDKDNRYTEDETVPQKSEQQIYEDVQRYAGKLHDRIAVGDGIDMPGEGKVREGGETKEIDEKIAQEENGAFAGRGLSTAEGGGMTYINEHTGKAFSLEDVAAERAIAMRQAKEKGQNFNEKQFQTQLKAKLEEEGYASIAIGDSIKAQIAKKGRKGRVGEGHDAGESNSSEVAATPEKKDKIKINRGDIDPDDMSAGR